jgi:flagellar assembly protein FliH
MAVHKHTSAAGSLGPPAGPEDERGAFVALHTPEAVTTVDLADRQLPPAGDERETSDAERPEHLQESERLRRLVQRVVERLLGERQNAVQAARAQIVELAMAIAERVVRTAVSLDHSIAERAAAEALTHVHGRERVCVRLNPGDLQYLRDSDAVAGLAQIERLELVEDEDVAAGGCVVETEMGSIDGRIETQLGQVEQSLLQALKTGRVDEPE